MWALDINQEQQPGLTLNGFLEENKNHCRAGQRAGWSGGRVGSQFAGEAARMRNSKDFIAAAPVA